MKKYMFCMAMAAVALASCSKNEISETNLGPAIEFRAAMGTRGETLDIYDCSISAVDSKGGSLFIGIRYEKQSDGSLLPYYSWGGANDNAHYYWPVDGSDVTFYSASPADIVSPYLNSDRSGLVFTFQPEQNLSTQPYALVDMVLAKTIANKNTGKNGVLLTFEHPLSQIEVQAKSDNSLYNFEVVGWRLAQIGTYAQYDWSAADPQWTFVNTPADLYTYEGACSPASLGSAYQSISGAGSIFLIPQQLTPWKVAGEPTNASNGAYLALKVRITTKSGTVAFPKSSNAELTHDWVAIPIDTKWEPGMKYVYKVDFTNGAGYVDPSTPAPDPSTDPDNPFNPGDEVLGGVNIGFSISVSQDWTESTTTPNNGQITM